MQISPDDNAVLQMLARIERARGKARRCLEVGSYTGSSALAVALAIADDGTIVAIDVDEEWAREGIKFFEEAGVRIS